MKYFAVVILAVSVLLAGCGGGGSSAPPSPFAGAWAGVLGVAAPGDPGMPTAIQLSVDRKGHLSGTWSDDGGSGPVTGVVSAGGTMTFSLGFAGPPAVTITGQGASSVAPDGSWSGALPDTDPVNAGMAVNFRATRQ